MPNSNSSNFKYEGRSAEEVSGMRSGYSPVPSSALNTQNQNVSIPPRGAPGSMTQAQIDARNAAVISGAAADNNNPQQNLYQQLYWRDKFPNQRSALNSRGQYSLTPYETFGQQFSEPIRGSGRSLTGGEYYDSEADPYGNPSDSYWLDTVKRFNNSINPNNPIGLNYPKENALDVANGSLIGSNIFAVSALGAAVAPSVAAAVPRHLIPSLPRVAPMVNSGVNAAINAFPRIAPLALPVLEFLNRRGVPIARNLKDFYSDLTFPFYAFSGPATSSLGANVMKAGMGAGAIYQGLDSYQHAMKEYGLTGSLPHALRAALRNQAVAAPVTPFGMLGAIPAGLASAGAGMAEDRVHGDELDRRSKQYDPSLKPGQRSLEEPTARDYHSPDPRRQQEAHTDLSKAYPTLAATRSVLDSLFDLKSIFGVSDGSTETRDNELLVSNLQRMENDFSLNDPEGRLDAASKFTDSVRNNLINVRGYNPKNITPEVMMQTVDAAAYTHIENVKNNIRRSYKGQESLSPLFQSIDGAYDKFIQTVASSKGEDFAISLAYHELMESITAIQRRRLHVDSRFPVTLPPLPGE
jgi:hypothetical protein